MKELGSYTTPLSVTSQFYFCGLPLRLDTYANCQFACQYCFAAARGGQRGARGLRPVDPDLLLRRLVRLRRDRSSAVGQMVGVRQAIHFGGMSDPLPPAERRLGVSLRVLKELATDDYPVVLSTKSTLVAEPRYADTLRRSNALVQFSFSTTDDTLSRRVDRGAPVTSERLRAIEKLRKAGVKVAARLQPILPGHEEDALLMIEQLGEVGVLHAGFEFLKVPLERSAGIDALSGELGRDLRQHFRERGSIRVGREWLLPAADRLAFALQARSATHARGMSFGAADTDLLPLSDSTACCSGADQVLPDATTFEFNYLGAVLRADRGGMVRLSSLREVWRPEGSIASMVNSRSRLPPVDGEGQPLESYIVLNWNGRRNGPAPDMFYGVDRTREHEADGSVVYRISSHLAQLMERRALPGRERLFDRD